MFDPKKILVPTDFSEFSGKALEEALDIAEEYHSKVYVLHVIDRSAQQYVADYCLPDKVMEQFEMEHVTISTLKMEDALSRITKANGVEIMFNIKKGIPYDEIIKEQEDNRIDLIVIASHGKNNLMKNMLGNVAHKVMQKATSPVLLVKA